MGPVMRIVLPLAAGLSGLACLILAWQFFVREPGPVRLVFSAGSPTGEYYDFARALADLAELRGSGIEISVRESAGAVANERAVAAGEADLGLIQSDTAASAPVRAVASVFPELFHIIVRREAGIAAPGDLVRRRIALMPEGSGTNEVFFRVAEHYGFAAADFDLRPMQATAAAEALKRGEVDAMVRMIALGNGEIRELLRHPGLRLLALDQADAIQMFAPALRRMTIPRGAINGHPARPSEDIEAIGVRALLIAGADVPEEAVREITAMLFEARNHLVRLDEQAALIEPASGLDDLGFALHAGSDAYYNADQPSFVVEYAEPLALGFTMMVVGASAFWQVRRWLGDRRKNRGDAYNSELADAIAELRAAGSQDELDAIEERMFAVFHRVLDDIDKDQVAEETIPTFDFVWRSAVDMLALRRAELRSVRTAEADRPEA